MASKLLGKAVKVQGLENSPTMMVKAQAGDDAFCIWFTGAPGFECLNEKVIPIGCLELAVPEN